MTPQSMRIQGKTDTVNTFAPLRPRACELCCEEKNLRKTRIKLLPSTSTTTIYEFTVTAHIYDTTTYEDLPPLLHNLLAPSNSRTCDYSNFHSLTVSAPLNPTFVTPLTIAIAPAAL